MYTPGKMLPPLRAFHCQPTVAEWNRIQCMNDHAAVKLHLESLRVERAAKKKSIERYRVKKDHTMANDLEEYVQKLDKEIAKLEDEIEKGSDGPS